MTWWHLALALAIAPLAFFAVVMSIYAALCWWIGQILTKGARPRRPDIRRVPASPRPAADER